ncbi:MAG: ribonuclease Z [Bacteroidetes bacterium]|nr:MAG: ribonuclease Z [Bacteroidota bacterium]
MDVFSVTVLGSSAALPTATRNLSGQLVKIANQYLLIDCGEGTQVQLRKNKISIQRINHVFISHLHGDHFYGLIGLLSTMHLLGRTKPIHIYAHEGLKKAIEVQLEVSYSKLSYELNFHFLKKETGVVIVENKHFCVKAIKLKHGIPCCGFLISEIQKPRNILKSAIDKYSIPIKDRAEIKMGADLQTHSGKSIKNEEITSDPPNFRSYAYCSDTAYSESIVDLISGVDLLYHEATFMDDKKDRAKETFHSTASQAAEIAGKAGVGSLLLGHFSARYKEMSLFLEEAMVVFDNVALAEDGKEYII